ncbi:Speckle-type POZ protein [Hordeum vulgare]|nr:Speckle-type POZ protein [Hordeum vulgare]
MAMDKGKEVVPPLQKGKEVVPRRTMASTIRSQDQATSARLSLLQSWRVCHCPWTSRNTSPIPAEFKTNTSCAWRVTMRLMNDKVTLDRGWDTFVVVHHIMIGYMLTFKLLTPDTMKVIVFDNESVKVVTKCKEDDNASIATACAVVKTWVSFRTYLAMLV